METFDVFIKAEIFFFSSHDLPDLAGHFIFSMETILPKTGIHFETVYGGTAGNCLTQTLTSAEFYHNVWFKNVCFIEGCLLGNTHSVSVFTDLEYQI